MPLTNLASSWAAFTVRAALFLRRAVTVDLNDSTSILAALQQGTEVVAVTGEVPGFKEPEDDVDGP